jgi:hypothetical protein
MNANDYQRMQATPQESTEGSLSFIRTWEGKKRRCGANFGKFLYFSCYGFGVRAMMAQWCATRHVKTCELAWPPSLTGASPHEPTQALWSGDISLLSFCGHLRHWQMAPKKMADLASASPPSVALK